MITLYSYPELFGVADNNGYGLKVFAFMRLAGVPFRHEHILDASAAPRGQLPYIVDDGETIGDSETIIAHVIGKYAPGIDATLDRRQRDMNLLVTRMLDDL
jgi:glutathione S-transferase